MTIMLEDSLRQMLTARVETPPVADDVASRVIRHGRVARRRRAAASLIAVSAALVLVVGGVMSLGGGWLTGDRGATSVAGFNADGIEPDLSAPVETTTAPGVDTGIGLDIRSGDQLWTTDGRRLPLSGVGEVTRVYRVPAGWVYAGVDKVRFLRTDGSSLSLSGEHGRWVLSADGERFAFQLGATLYLAKLTSNGMAVLGDVPVPAGSWPVALTGDRAVISEGGRGYAVVDLAEPVPPAPNAEVTAIYGVRGNDLLGLVAGKDNSTHCLARLTATAGRLAPSGGGACEFGPAGSPSGAGLEVSGDGMAPDGAWLAARRGTEVSVIDVGKALDGRTVAVDCPGDALVDPVWADSRTVVTGNDQSVVRCATDGTEQTMPLPEGVNESWQLVPRLMAGPTGQ
ncbi:hypothetical protein [Plantactinospora sonchi]|uniref:Uncharacterized protein n=1 Tax=Plantactinospora sonchi TaxID=1544735 RepID=A0ABU7RSM6_9ACTN